LIYFSKQGLQGDQGPPGEKGPKVFYIL
jgi:hypothetical protein